MRQTYTFHEQLRQTGFREVVEVVAAKGRLRAGLDVKTATDVLLTVYGDSTYHFMTAERGWSHERVIDWLCDVVPSLLLA